jgi:hypothetical protein
MAGSAAGRPAASVGRPPGPLVPTQVDDHQPGRASRVGGALVFADGPPITPNAKDKLRPEAWQLLNLATVDTDNRLGFGRIGAGRQSAPGD